MKALVGTFNQEKALVGAFSVIVQPVMEPMDRFTALHEMVHNAVPELKSDKSHDSVTVDFNASIVSVYIETDPGAGAAPGPPAGHLLLGGG